ncbi:HlyD family efflux transporter periplasmic adaptor subunit [Bacteroides stercorirosoris]|jgi:multidrug resistance efflux pump|uniref:HlyD family secretion protein n=1 Tax=Bacteroides stercorirosoris TaxID=871324 RepID=UPI003510DA19
MLEEKKDIELRSDEVQEVLGEVPTWLLRRGISLVAVIVILILLGSAFFKYPDVITSSVFLTSTNPAISIVAKSSGRILELYIDDNQCVKEGDVLAVIENSAKTKDIAYLKKYLLSINSLDSIDSLPVKDLKVGNLQALYSSFYLTLSEYIRFKEEQYYLLKIKWTQEKLKQYRMSYQDILRQKVLVEQQFEIVQKQYKRDSVLCSQRLWSEENLENSYNNYLQGKLSLENILATLNNMQLQIIQMCESLSDMEFQYSEKKNGLDIQINTYVTQLITEIQNWELNYAVVTPISGKVIFTQYWSKNQNVAAGEQVFNIIPNKAGTLMGKALLPAQRSGKVKVGQTVNIHFSNFPDNEFGFVKGVVGNISLVPSKTKEENNYVVEINLPGGLVTSYHKELPYLPEMGGTAEIVTDDLSLLERFILPIKRILKENL